MDPLEADYIAGAGEPNGLRGILTTATLGTASAAGELTLDALLRLRDHIIGPPRLTAPDLIGTLSNAELDALELEGPVG